MNSHNYSREDFDRMMQVYLELPKDIEVLTAKLSAADPFIRLASVMKMRELNDPQVMDALLAAFDDESENVRSMVALALVPYAEQGSLPSILGHLANDPSTMVRCMSAVAAGLTHTNAAMDALSQALLDSDPTVRSTACGQFADNNDKRALGRIYDLHRDSEEIVRSQAAVTLIRLGVVDDIVMDMMINDPSMGVRREIVEELLRLDVADPRIVEVIERMMNEPADTEHDGDKVRTKEIILTCKSRNTGKAGEMLCNSVEAVKTPLTELLAKAHKLVGKSRSKR